MAKNELCILCGKEVLDGNIAYERPCHLTCSVKAGDDKTKAASLSSTPKDSKEKTETVVEKKVATKKKKNEKES